jgi:hypothetical protein
MSLSLDELLDDFSGNVGTDNDVLREIEKNLAVKLPSDYKSFLSSINGGEGFVGKHYLILWKAEELAQFNEEYQVAEYAPGLMFFGSNGGGEGFAFDTRVVPFRIVEVPFVGMSLECAITVADSFPALLDRMVHTDGSLF